MGKLRNDIAGVLRRADQGERFTVTASGRPVAELGPLPGARALAPQAKPPKEACAASPVLPATSVDSHSQSPRLVPALPRPIASDYLMALPPLG